MKFGFDPAFKFSQGSNIGPWTLMIYDSMLIPNFIIIDM